MTKAIRAHGGYTDDQDPHILDLSTCIDAFGLFAPIQRALYDVSTKESYRAYPDPASKHARTAIAEWCDVDLSHLDVGPGAAEIIWTLVRACVRPNNRVLAWEPCFSEFVHAAHAQGARVITHGHNDDQRPIDVRLDEFSKAVRTHEPVVAYLCAPSSPLGEWVPAEMLSRVVTAHPGTLFLVDQSYLNLSRHAAETNVRLGTNAVLLRSLTKELGLPGVRVGYAIMSSPLREKLQQNRPHWSLGTHAQTVLEAYPKCQSLLAKRREQLLQQASHLALGVARLGFQPRLADAHYFTFSPPHGSSHTATTITQALVSFHAIAVRDCTSFGLPNHVRIVAHPEQERLLRALATFVSR